VKNYSKRKKVKVGATFGKTAPLKLNDGLSTNWIDMVTVDSRNDGNLLIRFLTILPEGASEQARLMTSKKHSEKIIDIFCSALDYHPVKG